MIGGFLMVWSGYVSRSVLFLAIGYLQSEVPAYLTGFAASAASFSISILDLIVALGGITVILGGIVLISGHARVGRILILLGGGAGVLGLIASFGYTVFKLGFSQTISYMPYWVGLAFAAAARWVSKGARNKVNAPASGNERRLR